MSERLVFWDVDTQRDFMVPDGALYVPQAEEIVSSLDRLTRTAEAMAIPVIAGADDHEASDAEISSEPDFRTTFPPHCMQGTPGTERIRATRLEWTLKVGHDRLSPEQIRSALANPWPRVLIPKKGLDIFSNPNTDEILDVLAPDRIVVYGVALEFCIRYVVDGLLERSYSSIVLPTDAIRAIYPGESQMLLRRWQAAGVRLETTPTVLGELDRTARFAVG